MTPARPPIDDPLDTFIARAEQARAEGALGAGLAWAEQAWADLPADDPARRRRLGLLLLDLRYRTGALAPVVEVALELLPLLRAAGAGGELFDTLRTTALAACEASRFEVALACAQEAHALALAQGDTARISLATNALACYFERAGDPWQAERLMLESLALARGQADPFPVLVALNNLSGALIGKFHLLRDAMPLAQAREPLHAARQHAQEAVARAVEDGRPFFRTFTLSNLGEILVNLGEADGARQALDAAMALATQHGFEAQSLRLGCALGELQLLTGQPELACRTLRALLQAPGAQQHCTTCMRAHHAQWRAARALGQDGEALQHLQAYTTLERQRTLTQLRAQSDLFVSRIEAEQVRQEAQRQRARASALEADVRRDPLTGLGNRREMEERWPAMLQQAQRSGAPLSVAALDLDHFKQVNDRFGHAVGDQVLVALAGLLRSHTREVDLVVRQGGEEFLLAMPATAPDQAMDACERLRRSVAEHDWEAVAPGLQVTLSVGLFSAPPLKAEQLIAGADAALYRAKAGGRNRVVREQATTG
jgi:diguanylate cyclase (GGDEF)-like protein